MQRMDWGLVSHTVFTVKHTCMHIHLYMYMQILKNQGIAFG